MVIEFEKAIKRKYAFFSNCINFLICVLYIFSKTEKIGLISSVSKLLGVEDYNIIKLTKIYSQKLEEDLKQLHEKIDEIPISYEEINLEKYEFLFFKIFIEILG